MSHYSDPLVADFARRTRANLDLVREAAKTHPDKAYEVTQLINSMLGLLVFPQQQYFRSIPRIPLADLANSGWPIPQIEGNFPQVADLPQLVGKLRNAIAHFNVEFISEDGQISGIRLWNIPPRQTEKNWQAVLKIDELETITENFIALLIGQPRF